MLNLGNITTPSLKFEEYLVIIFTHRSRYRGVAITQDECNLTHTFKVPEA